MAEDKIIVREKIKRAIEPKEYFYCCNGTVIKSLEELPGVIEKISGNDFYTHVTNYKNDFAKWIYDVYGLAELASLLGPVKSKEEIVRIMRAYLAANLQEQPKPIERSAEKPIPEPIKKEDIKQIQQNAEPKSIPAEHKFADVEKLKSPVHTEEHLSQRILNLISKLEEKVEERIKRKPMMLPPKDIPDIKAGEEEEKQGKFVLPQVRKTDNKQFEDKVNQIKERLKNEAIPEQLKQEIKQPEPVIEKKPEPIIQQPKEEPKQEESKPAETSETEINDPGRYFQKNPVLVSQMIEAKKQAMQIEKLALVSYSGGEQQNELAEKFKDNYAKAYQFMVSMRKAGFDTSIAEIMVARIPTKIKVYEASHDDRDAIPVKRYLNEAIEELNNMK